MPEGAIVVFSAHGVAPVGARGGGAAAACARSTRPARWSPRCTRRPRRFAAEDYDILLIGHEGHEEVVGTAGEAPEHIHLVDGPDDVDRRRGPRPAKVVWLSQTTLSVDETMETVRRAARAVPAAAGPAERRHLLRHAEPPGRGEADRRATATW